MGRNNMRWTTNSSGYNTQKASGETRDGSPVNKYRQLFIRFLFLSAYTVVLWGHIPYFSSLGSKYIAAFRNLFNTELPIYQSWVIVSGFHFFFIPLIIAKLFLKMPLKKMGIRGISFSHFKILVILYLLSLPILIWLGSREGMYHYYEPYLKNNPLSYLAWTNLVMLFEHSSLQGILISILDPDFFDTSKAEKIEPVKGIDGKMERVSNNIKDWFRLDRYYLTVIFLDGLLFMLIHVGKPISELSLAFPGGVVLAFLAFKFKSFLACYLIHTMSGATIIAIIILLN